VNADCHTLRPLIGSYVLSGLEPDEAEAVREHLATCPGCAAEHARLAPLPGLLTLAAGAEAATADPPPAALEERLLDAVAREAPARRRRARSRWMPRRPWLAAGLATAVAAAAVAGLVIAGDDGPPGYNVTLQASAAAPRASAWAELRQVAGGTSMHLWVSGLPRDDKAVYEVHCDAPGWTASGGTFRAGPDGAAYVTLTTAARRGQYDAIRIVRRDDHRVVFSASLT
jgi:anti-sigma factor RsiW